MALGRYVDYVNDVSEILNFHLQSEVAPGTCIRWELLFFVLFVSAYVFMSI